MEEEMNEGNLQQCPVCTLYLRNGITMEEHLHTHSKEKVIQTLLGKIKSTPQPSQSFTNQTQSTYIKTHTQMPSFQQFNTAVNHNTGDMFYVPIEPNQNESIFYQYFVTKTTNPSSSSSSSLSSSSQVPSVFVPTSPTFYNFLPSPNNQVPSLQPYFNYYQQQPPLNSIPLIMPVQGTTSSGLFVNNNHRISNNPSIIDTETLFEQTTTTTVAQQSNNDNNYCQNENKTIDEQQQQQQQQLEKTNVNSLKKTKKTFRNVLTITTNKRKTKKLSIEEQRMLNKSTNEQQQQQQNNNTNDKYEKILNKSFGDDGDETRARCDNDESNNLTVNEKSIRQYLEKVTEGSIENLMKNNQSCDDDDQLIFESTNVNDDIKQKSDDDDDDSIKHCNQSNHDQLFDKQQGVNLLLPEITITPQFNSRDVVTPCSSSNITQNDVFQYKNENSTMRFSSDTSAGVIPPPPPPAYHHSTMRNNVEEETPVDSITLTKIENWNEWNDLTVTGDEFVKNEFKIGFDLKPLEEIKDPMMANDNNRSQSPKVLLNLSTNLTTTIFEKNNHHVNWEQQDSNREYDHLIARETLNVDELSNLSASCQMSSIKQDGEEKKVLPNLTTIKLLPNVCEKLPILTTQQQQLSNSKMRKKKGGGGGGRLMGSHVEIKCKYCKIVLTSYKERREHQTKEHPNLVAPAQLFKNQIKIEEIIKIEDLPEGNIRRAQIWACAKLSEKLLEFCKCSFCDMTLMTQVELKKHHREQHLNEPFYRCPLDTCLETFKYEAIYQQHLKIHPLKCDWCKKQFYYPRYYIYHLNRHLNKLMTKHMSTSGGGGGGNIMDLKVKSNKGDCKKKTIGQCNLTGQYFECDQCPLKFNLRIKLFKHQLQHQKNQLVNFQIKQEHSDFGQQQKFKCHYCNEKFTSMANLVAHKQTHHMPWTKKNQRDYMCAVCNEVFQTKRKYDWHMEIHDQKPKCCDKCSEKFVHTSSLTRHIRKAHDKTFKKNSDKNVVCYVCNGVYLKTSFVTHLTIHQGIKAFVCNICDKSFTTKWNLKQHKWTHAARSTKPFKCQQCKSAFVRQTDFVAHQNSHKNWRPYCCNYCGKKFIRKNNWVRHEREHVSSKSYACHICKKQFHRSYYLHDHMNMHRGIKPYACHICAKRSTTKSNHNKHIKIHHARDTIHSEG